MRGFKAWVFSGLILLTGGPVSAVEQVQIWVKAFMPDSDSNSPPGYFQPVPNRSGTTMTPAYYDDLSGGRPGLGEPASCYVTDGRQFSTNPLAPARLTVEFSLFISNDTHSTYVILPVESREVIRLGDIERVKCDTGESLGTGKGIVSRNPSLPLWGIRGPTRDWKTIEWTVECLALNYPPFNGTAAGFINLTFAFHTEAKTLTIKKGTVGQYLAYEAYASRNGQKPAQLFAMPPTYPDNNTQMLAGLGMVTSREVQSGTSAFSAANSTLSSWYVGTWSATNGNRRLRMTVAEGWKMEIQEERAGGESLRHRIKMGGNSKVDAPVVELTNDKQAMEFLGYRGFLQQAILEAGPKPSLLSLRREGNGIHGTLKDLTVVRDKEGFFTKLVQPEEGTPVEIVFTKQGE